MATPTLRARLDARLLLLLLILIVALHARIDAVTDHILLTPEASSRLVGDEPGYQYLAERWAAAEPLDWPARMPLYPAFLGTAYSVLGVNIDLVLYLQAVLGAATVALLYLVVRRYHGASVGWLAALLAAIHPGMITSATRIHSENLYIPLLILVAAGLFELMDRLSVRSALGFGMLVALAAYCRPTGALLFLVVPLVCMRRSVGAYRTMVLTLVSTAVVLVALTPWTIHNWRTYDVVHPLTPSIAVLWQGSPEYYDLWRSGRGYLDIWRNELNPAVNGGYEPSTWEGDRHFTRRALESIRERPLTYAWYSVQKALYYWIGHPSANWARLPFLPLWERLHRMVVYLWAPLCFGAAILIGFWRRLDEFVPYVLLAAYFTIVHALLWAELRLSEPLQPLLTVFLAVWLVEKANVPGWLTRALSPQNDSGEGLA